MKLFKRDEGSESRSVVIKNQLRFWLAIDHTSSGLSFRQTAAVIEQHRRRTKNPKLSGISDHMVLQFVRVIVAVDLQFLSKILSRSDVWAFSIACDGSSHFGISYLDIRIRLSVEGVLYNFHLVLVPF